MSDGVATRKRRVAATLAGWALAVLGAGSTAAEPPANAASAVTTLAAPKARVTLPPGIAWQTNEEDPPIGSAEALRGSTLNESMGSYPLTFRLMGPNSNDAFAGWKDRKSVV